MLRKDLSLFDFKKALNIMLILMYYNGTTFGGFCSLRKKREWDSLSRSQILAGKMGRVMLMHLTSEISLSF